MLAVVALCLPSLGAAALAEVPAVPPNPAALASPALLVHRTAHHHGLGNRMLGAVSSLALARATNRTFVLEWKRDTAPGGAYPWRFDDLFAATDAAVDLEVAGVPEGDLYRAMLSLVPNRDEQHHRLLCHDPRERYAAAPVLAVMSNQFYHPLLEHNAHLAADAPVFASLGGELFRPHPSYAPALDALGVLDLGVHLRYFEGRDNLTRTALIGHALECALAHDPGPRWYVAADSSAAVDEFAGLAEARGFTVLTGPDLGAATHRRDDWGSTSLVRSAFDLFALSRASQLVVTHRSSFGAAAFALGGAGDVWQVSNTTRCERVRRRDPCFHHWRAARTAPCYDPSMEEEYAVDAC